MSNYQDRGNVAPRFEYEREKQGFLAAIQDPANQAEFRKLLSSDAEFDGFMAAAVDVVTTPPGKKISLLRPDLRTSLMFALRKAARQGLRPDGKEGALIPRKNHETGLYGVEWQPMVWGIMKLGRATGAISKFNARIVYEGEPFRLLAGSEDKIVHEMLPQAMAGGLEHAIGAYCIITQANATEMWRFLLKSDIYERRKVSQAFRNGGGPWIGAFEPEMWLKTVIRFTAKWIELDPNSIAARRFWEALDHDLGADFDQNVIEGEAQEADDAPAALPPPDEGDKLARYETQQMMNGGREREPAPVHREEQRQESAPARQEAPSGPPPGHPAGEPERQPEQPKQQAKPPATTSAGRTPQDFAEWFKREVVDPCTSAAQYGALAGSTATRSRLARLKKDFPEIYDETKAHTHAKLRSLGVADNQLGELA